MQIIKKYYKIALTILGIFIVIGLIYWAFTNYNKPTSEKSYSTLKFAAFPFNLKLGSDFNYISSLNVNSDNDNFVYKVKSDDSLTNVTKGALKLGLSNESNNNPRKLRVWTKAGVDDLSGDYVTYDDTSGTFRFKYAAAINSQSVDAIKAYDAVTEFFGLAKQEVTLVSNAKSGSANILSYKAKYNNRPVVFKGLDEIYGTIEMTNGKITQAFFYILPNDLEKSFDMKPLTRVDSDTLGAGYYLTKLTPSEVSTSSSSGSEISFFKPSKVASTDSSFGYFYTQDSSFGKILVPSLFLTGNYSDAKDFRGKSLVVLVNQGF